MFEVGSCQMRADGLQGYGCMAALCDLLSNHIKAQFKDLERAIIGMGKFRLHESYQHFKIQINNWAGKKGKKAKNVFQIYKIQSKGYR